MINFDGKKALIQPSATNNGKGKEVIICDARETDENANGGETLKVTITTSDTGGQEQAGSQARAPVLCIADGLAHKREWSGTPPNSSDQSSGQSGNAQDQRRPHAFKPR
jgi:hypothetical protein